MLDQSLVFLRGLDEVGQTALHALGQVALFHESRNDGTRLLHLLVYRLERRKRCALPCEQVAGFLFLLAGHAKALLVPLYSIARLVSGLTSLLELARYLLLAGVPLANALLARLDLLVDLSQTTPKELVLDLGVAYLVAQLCVRERLLVGRALCAALVGLSLRKAPSQVFATLLCLASRRHEFVDLSLELVPLGTSRYELLAHAPELLLCLLAVVCGRACARLQIGDARRHVAALLAKEARVGIQPGYLLLQARALCAKVAHKDALFLE